MLTEFAPAKLNLYLHITGRRPDGYHDLDSLTIFAGVGDELRLVESDHFAFEVEGPQAPLLRNEDPTENLAVKAAHSLAEITGYNLDTIKLILVKNLPVASGIGGGSSDAAATLRILARHWKLPIDDPRLLDAARPHGQDVPVCVKPETTYITASGHRPGPQLPAFSLLLVNPNRGLPTPSVYKEFRNGGYVFSPRATFAKPVSDLGVLIDLLKARKNDLYDPAAKLLPEIRDIVSAIGATKNCLLARMSGSGATCFGIYCNQEASSKAKEQIMTLHPGWWVSTCDLL